MRISENGIIRRISRDIVTGILAVIISTGASIAWFFAYIFFFGASTAIECAIVYSIGIPISAGAGIIFGILRKAPVNPLTTLVGWSFALPLSPPAFVLRNPANADSDGKAVTLVLLAFSALVGSLGAVLGTRNNQKTLYTFAIIIALAMVVFTLFLVRYI